MVSNDLTGGDKDNLSRLFYEAHLVCQNEKENYERLICVYAIHCNWHYFLMDMSKVKKECVSNLKGSDLAPQVVCTIISDFILQIYSS